MAFALLHMTHKLLPPDFPWFPHCRPLSSSRSSRLKRDDCCYNADRKNIAQIYSIHLHCEVVLFLLTANIQSPRHSTTSNVMPDLLPPHTPPQSRSPPTPQRPQDKTTSDEVYASVIRHENSICWWKYLEMQTCIRHENCVSLQDLLSFSCQLCLFF